MRKLRSRTEESLGVTQGAKKQSLISLAPGYKPSSLKRKQRNLYSYTILISDPDVSTSTHVTALLHSSPQQTKNDNLLLVTVNISEHLFYASYYYKHFIFLMSRNSLKFTS